MRMADPSFITARKRTNAPSTPPAGNSTASSLSAKLNPRPPTDSPDEPNFVLPAHAVVWILPILLVAAGYEFWRTRQPPIQREPLPRFPPLLWIAFALALILVTSAMTAAWEANPQGNWDAWSIWNLRAKFLAAGSGLAARAWSPMLSFNRSPQPVRRRAAGVLHGARDAVRPAGASCDSGGSGRFRRLD